MKEINESELRKIISKYDDYSLNYIKSALIELNNRGLLEDLQFIPVRIENGETSIIELKPISSCDEEDIVKYIEGLVGFVLIENI